MMAVKCSRFLHPSGGARERVSNIELHGLLLVESRMYSIATTVTSKMTVSGIASFLRLRDKIRLWCCLNLAQRHIGADERLRDVRAHGIAAHANLVGF